MGKLTEALKRVGTERISRIQKKPDVRYVTRKVENTDIDPHIVSFHDPLSPITEQYKIARTNIQTLKSTKNYKTFVVTSSVHGEGKSITSTNLAMTLAHDLDDKSVLLIDADMRKGKAAKYLGINPSPGLSELLKGEVKIDSVLVSPDMDNLTIIPPGKVPDNPAELLNSKKMKTLIASFKQRFDYILIDTPPIMPLTDACTFGTLVDGAILVIQAGRTQRGVVKQSISRMSQSGLKPLGYIMTHVEYHLPQYLYRYVQEYDSYKYYNKVTEKINN